MAEGGTNGGETTFASGLAAALRATGVSQKELARRLSGPGATDRQIENKRTSILRWLAGKHEPEESSAREVERALDLDDGQLVGTIRRTPRGRAPKPDPREEELRLLREELAELRGRVAALETGQPHQPDVPAEIRSA